MKYIITVDINTPQGKKAVAVDESANFKYADARMEVLKARNPGMNFHLQPTVDDGKKGGAY